MVDFTAKDLSTYFGSFKKKGFASLIKHHWEICKIIYFKLRDLLQTLGFSDDLVYEILYLTQILHIYVEESLESS